MAHPIACRNGIRHGDGYAFGISGIVAIALVERQAHWRD